MRTETRMISKAFSPKGIAIATLAAILVFSGCEVKGPDFFAPTLGDQSLLPDLDGPVFSDFKPWLDLDGPQNVDLINFSLTDPGGSNGAIPSGVDPSTVRTQLGGLQLDLTQSGNLWQGEINGFQDGPTDVELFGSDIAGNTTSFSYDFYLKRDDPVIQFSQTPGTSLSSDQDEVGLEFQGTIVDPFLGGAWAGIFDFGSDGICGTADDQPWPQGTDPGAVSANSFDFSGNLGPGGAFNFSAMYFNPVQAEGESRMDDVCFRVWAEDTAEDGMGGPNPNTSLITFTTSLDWSRPVTTGSIVGTVTLDNEPIAGVNISAGGLMRTTAGDGTYRFDGLDPQGYTVSISPPAGTQCTPASQNAQVQAGMESVADFACATSPGAIVGTVTVGGEPAPGVTVSAAGGSQQTGQDGSYRFDGLVPGPYAVTVTPPDGTTCEPQSKQTQVQAGQESTVDFACTFLPGSIAGTVTLDGSPLEGVTVSVGGASQQTGSDGTYLFEGLAAGSYTVSLSGLGPDVSCDDDSKNADVLPAQESVVDFTCDTEENFTVEAVGSYRHFVGFSRICLVVKTTPAQPNVPFKATATGPFGGVSGSGIQEGTLDAMGEAEISNDILLYGSYNWLLEIGGESWNIPVEVTAAAGSCTF